MGLDNITPAVTIYLVMVFGAVFLLSQGLIVPAFGDNRRAEKRVRKRLAQISSHAQRQAIRSLLRDKYLFENRGEFYVKDKGELKTYFLKGRKAIRSLEPTR